MTERQIEVVRWTIVTLLMVGMVLFLTCLPGSARADQGVIYAPVGSRVVLLVEAAGKPAEKNAASVTPTSAAKPTVAKKLRQSGRRVEDPATSIATQQSTTDATQDRRIVAVESASSGIANAVDQLADRVDNAAAHADATDRAIAGLADTTAKNDKILSDEVQELAIATDARDHSYGLFGLGHGGVHLLVGGGFSGNVAGAAGGSTLTVGYGRPFGIELAGAYGYSGKVDGQTVYQVDVATHATFQTRTPLTLLLGARYEHRAAPNSTNWWGGEGGLRYYATPALAVQGTIALGRLFVDQNQSEVAPGGSLSALVNF